MYKLYETDDYLKVVNESAEKIREILLAHKSELEQFNEDINDRYPFEDLYLRYEEVDSGIYFSEMLLEYLELCRKARIEEKRSEYRKVEASDEGEESDRH